MMRCECVVVFIDVFRSGKVCIGSFGLWILWLFSWIFKDLEVIDREIVVSVLKLFAEKEKKKKSICHWCCGSRYIGTTTYADDTCLFRLSLCI